MAKRRKLEAPSADALRALEAELDASTPSRAAAPIAQVAGESAQLAPLADARDIEDAAALRDAQKDRRLIVEIPLDEIDPMAMVRDRVSLNPEEMDELKESIQASGLRLPIEVYALSEDGAADTQGHRYGLISGYRRYVATKELRDITQGTFFTSIKALVVPRVKTSAAFAQMVEENEVRAALSPYERGRIAVIAAGQGAFANSQAAVDGLFPAASKAKRSKIRSFAMVFEELGDLIQYGDQMGERQGLRLAAALRQGAETQLRAALEGRGQASGFSEEWAELEPVLAALEAQETPRQARGGRPRSKPAPRIGWADKETLHLSSGFTLTWAQDGDAGVLRIGGRKVDRELGENVMLMIQRLLDTPD